MAVTKLTLYNEALTAIGERKLSSLYENREPRRVLDSIWNLGVIDYCLEVTKPKFALKVAALSSPTTSSVHGLDQVYNLPSDYVSTVPGDAFFADENLENPVHRYILEGRTVATNVTTTLYVRYVANSASMSDWTPSFANVVSSYLAREVAARLNPSKIEETQQEFDQRVQSTIGLEGAKEIRPLPQQAGTTLDSDTLALYNQALKLLGLDELRYGDDDSRVRLALDVAFDDGVEQALELTKPAFARAVAELTGPATSGVHGLPNDFTLPADYLALLNVFKDDKLDEPVARYFRQTNIISSEYSTLYIRYITNNVTVSDWTPGFRWFFASYLAMELASRFPEGWEPLDKDRNAKRIQQVYQSRLEYVMQHEQAVEPLQRATPSVHTLTDDWRDIYNKALMCLDLPPILSNDDDSEARAALDFAVDTGAFATILTKISWGWAWKQVELTGSDNTEPPHGWSYEFTVPADMERIDMLAGDDHFHTPIRYYREGDKFYANVKPLYIRYVSNTDSNAPGNWPEYFKDLVAAEMARRCTRLPRANVQKANRLFEEYKSEAYSTDAQRNPPQIIRHGNWVQDRYSAFGSRRRRP